MALTAERDTPRKPETPEKNFPMKSATKVYKGGLVGLNAGYLVPMTTALALKCVGRAKATVDNTGADGAKTCDVEEGIFRWVNGDSIAQADVGADCFATDDQTVAKSSSGTKSRAGQIHSVDADGVWVLSKFEEQESDANGGGAFIQGGTGTLSSGVLTVATGITVTANSRVVMAIKTPGGTFSDGGLDAPSADRVVGGPGVGTIVIRGLVQAGTANVNDTSTVDYLIFG